MLLSERVLNGIFVPFGVVQCCDDLPGLILVTGVLIPAWEPNEALGVSLIRKCFAIPFSEHIVFSCLSYPLYDTARYSACPKRVIAVILLLFNTVSWWYW